MRYKTFEATGIAPNGRLYAGDLNGIQDLYAAKSDYTQAIDLGTLRVGDSTLQLIKYGAGEFRMSGSLRIDGIFRGLGGLIAGAFTTAQRDAIPAGSRPYGLIILNTTTNRYEWNGGTDATPDWKPLSGATSEPPPPGEGHAAQHLPGGADPLSYWLINLSGTRAAKPSAAAVNRGLFYFETDWNVLWYSTGSAWLRCSFQPKSCTLSEFLSLSPADSDEVMVQIATGIRWHLRYNGSGGYWEAIGGASLVGVDDSKLSTSSGSYVNGTPTVQIPLGGVYKVEINATAGGIDHQPVMINHGYMAVYGPGQSASDAYCAHSTHPAGYFVAWGIGKTMQVTFNGSGTVGCAYRTYNADAVEFERRSIAVTPIRVTT